jgi:hypothetical protein
MFSDIASRLLLVHGEHALGDEEAAEDVHAREDEAEKAEDAGDARALLDQRVTDQTT